MSEVLAIRASNNGQLQLSIRTESVTVDTQWTNCTNPKMGGPLSVPYCSLNELMVLCICIVPSQSQDDGDESGGKVDPDHLFTVLVSIRSFLKFLNSHVVSTTTIACQSFSIVCHSDSMLMSHLFRHMPESLHDSLCLCRGRSGCWRGVDVLYSRHHR
jgi:hypothetical protein